MFFKLLFPGVIFHELSHYLACVFFGVKVYSTRLFDSNEAYIQHAKPNAWQAFAISIAPFVVNNFLGVWLLLFANDLLVSKNLVALLFYWLAISFIFHSFPSDTDAMNSFNAAKGSFLKRINRGSIFSRLAWLVVTPFIFIPVLLITGLLLVFDKSNFLKAGWLFVVFWTALQPYGFATFINNIFI